MKAFCGGIGILLLEMKPGLALTGSFPLCASAPPPPLTTRESQKAPEPRLHWGSFNFFPAALTSLPLCGFIAEPRFQGALIERRRWAAAAAAATTPEVGSRGTKSSRLDWNELTQTSRARARHCADVLFAQQAGCTREDGRLERDAGTIAHKKKWPTGPKCKKKITPHLQQ